MPRYLHRSVVDVNWLVTPEVEGRIVLIDNFLTDKGNRDYLAIDTEKSIVRVYKSADLEEVFALAKVGHFIRVRFVEKKQTKAGNTVNKHHVQLWDDPDAPEVVPISAPKRNKKGDKK